MYAGCCKNEQSTTTDEDERAQILDFQVHVTLGCIHCKTEAFFRDFTKFDKCVEVYSYNYQLCRATGL